MICDYCKEEITSDSKTVKFHLSEECIHGSKDRVLIHFFKPLDVRVVETHENKHAETVVYWSVKDRIALIPGDCVYVNCGNERLSVIVNSVSWGIELVSWCRVSVYEGSVVERVKIET